MTTITIICEMCGARFSAVSPRRRFCYSCTKERDREQAKLRYIKSKTKRASGLADKAYIQEHADGAEWHSLADKFERKEKFPSIDEVAKAAAKAGMTYGKYVEKYGGKWQ